MDNNTDKQNTMDFVLEKSTPDKKPEQDVGNPIANIPVVFCANPELAKALLVDIFALIGALRGIEEGQIDKQMIPKVLSNSQQMLSNFGDLLIRDCNLSDKDLEEVMRVFATQASSATPVVEKSTK